MSIAVTCVCGKRYQLADALAGKKAKCRECGNLIQVPGATAAAAGIDPNRMLELLDELGSQPERSSVQSDGLLPSPISEDYRASNPGGFEINFGHYFACNKALFIIVGGGLLFAIAVVPFAPLAVPVITVGSIVAVSLFEIYKLRRKCREGDVNPGIVVSLKPPLVAVMTDLTMTGQEARPAIEISRHSLGHMAGGPATLGMHLPTVSLYAGHQGGRVWRDFEPEVINCMTTDLQTITRLRASIPPRDWAALEQALERLIDKRPGLYRLWEPGWNTAKPQFQLGSMLKLLGIVAAVVVVLLIGLFVLLVGVRNWLLKPPQRPAVRPPPIQRPAPPNLPVPGNQPRPFPQPARPQMPAPGVPIDMRQLKVGDRVFAQSGERWWPAKVLQLEENRALVDYQVPPDTPDEWVEADRLRHIAPPRAR